MTDSKKPASAVDSHISPPLDPHPAYQSTYSRHTSGNENPFISFRRFADEQFNSLLSDLPRILGVPTSLSPQPESANKSFEERSSEQATRLEAELKEMIRRRHEDAEGFRKQMEQEREERRLENERRNGVENARWGMMQNGTDRYPALKQNTTEPATELDMYDRLEEERREDDRQRRNCRWKREGRRGWLSGLGWDGKGKEKNAHKQDTQKPTSQQDLTPLNLEPEEHLADLDPFKHDDDLHAYLTESKYSPIHLMLPNCFAAWRTSSPRQESNSMSDALSATDLDRRMADRLQWSEAFNDLLSLEKTGQLPPREHASIFDMAPFRESIHGPFSDPFSREMKRLIEKSPRRDTEDGFRDGDFWDGDIDISLLGTGVMALLMGAALSGVPVRTIGNNQHISKRDSEQKQDQGAETQRNDPGIRGMLWQGPEAILSLIEHVKQQELEGTSSSEPVREDVQTPSSVHDNITSSSTSSSSSGMSSWSVSNNNSLTDNSTSIISTLTTTQTRTLPDGTTETKRVLKRRFADGREEHDESVEVYGGTGKIPMASITTPSVPSKIDHTHPPASSPLNKTEKTIESKPKEKEPKRQVNKTSDEKGGWFWN